MQVVDSVENLPDRLRSVLLSELSLLANTVEQLAARCELRHNIVFVLAMIFVSDHISV
jgi:hypothetical protein